MRHITSLYVRMSIEADLTANRIRTRLYWIKWNSLKKKKNFASFCRTSRHRFLTRCARDWVSHFIRTRTQFLQFMQIISHLREMSREKKCDGPGTLCVCASYEMHNFRVLINLIKLFSIPCARCLLSQNLSFQLSFPSSCPNSAKVWMRMHKYYKEKTKPMCNRNCKFTSSNGKHLSFTLKTVCAYRRYQNRVKLLYNCWAFINTFFGVRMQWKFIMICCQHTHTHAHHKMIITV